MNGLHSRAKWSLSFISSATDICGQIAGIASPRLSGAHDFSFYENVIFPPTSGLWGESMLYATWHAHEDAIGHLPGKSQCPKVAELLSACSSSERSHWNNFLFFYIFYF